MKEKGIFRNIRVEVIYYLLLALFTGLMGYLSLGKGFDFDIYPSVWAGDAVYISAIIKGIQENGFWGIWFNSRIGAPEMAVLIDFPVIGNIMALIIWMISWFTSCTARILYSYLIITFVLDGVSLTLLLRKLKINREVSFVIGSLFAFAPYHFYRYVSHASLINYIAVPIAIYLAFNVIGEIEDEKKWKIVLCTILLGQSYGYYYAFGLIILAVAYLFRFINLENKKEIIKKLWIMILLLFVILLSNMPRLIYSLVNGRNTEAGHRFFFEQEIYGLKIINLLLPVTYSKIEPLRKLTESYVNKAPLVTENRLASLGLIGSIGFVILCGTLIVSFVKKKECCEGFITDFCSLTTLVFVLVGTIGGFGEIFNWAVTSQIRCYNRASIVITGLSLIGLAVFLNQVKYKSKLLSIIVCGIILAVGCFDQINILSPNWQDGIRPGQEMYEDYFANVESSLEEGAMVYQLPYLDFPELNAKFDYKHFVAYLFTDKLRWSYGGVRGRDLAAKELNVHDGKSYVFLDGIKNAGFQAVYIDLDGYAALGGDGEQVLAFYDSLDIEPMVSADGKLYVYDISKLEIPEEWFVPGYSFVHEWADKHHVDASVDVMVDVAKGLDNLDTAAYEIMYNWMISSEDILGAGDAEYIDYLYRILLDREAGDEEMALWLNIIQDGESREGIFCLFLNAEEFRNKEHLAD